jgi:ATP-binding protein involved in chromosome partitioning
MSDNIINESQLKNAIDAYPDPETGQGLVRMDQLQELRIDGSNVELKIGLSSFSAPLKESVREELAKHLRESIEGLSEVRIDFSTFDRPAEKKGEFGLRIKKIVAVGSGKGGVGKSTVSTLMALALAESGAKVGLLDADLQGPSVPHLLGAVDPPHIENDKLIPLKTHGLSVLSMGMLMGTDQAVMWRGPRLHSALTQFFRDTEWGELDYLIVDMPPGTGDIPISLVQLVPLSGAVVVCTPQPVALIDAVRAVTMFNHSEVPVLGIVENMSRFDCPDCGSSHEIFGAGGAVAKAREFGLPLLGELPINIAMRTAGDKGLLPDLLQDETCRPAILELGRNLAQVFADQSRENPPMPELTIL